MISATASSAWQTLDEAYSVTKELLRVAHVEALVDGAGDSSEIPRVDLDGLVELRRDTSELGDDERSLVLGLAEDVPARGNTISAESTRRRKAEPTPYSWCSYRRESR